MATHSSTLAWEIPWTEEPGELQSTELQESDMTVIKQQNLVSTSYQGGIHEKDHIRSKTKCENQYKYFVGKVDNVHHQKSSKCALYLPLEKWAKDMMTFHSTEKCRWFINTRKDALLLPIKLGKRNKPTKSIK